MSALSKPWLDKCCFTSTETVGSFGTGAQDGQLDLALFQNLPYRLTLHTEPAVTYLNVNTLAMPFLFEHLCGTCAIAIYLRPCSSLWPFCSPLASATCPPRLCRSQTSLSDPRRSRCHTSYSSCSLFLFLTGFDAVVIMTISKSATAALVVFRPVV